LGRPAHGGSLRGKALDGVALSSLGLFAALFFVALNGLFVSAEFSFVKIRATQVERLVQEGRASAQLVREATRKLDAYLAVCQLGITISSLSLGALGEPAIASLIEPSLGSILPENFVHAVAFAIGFSIITSLHVILGELVPKSVGIQRPEGTSLFIAPFMRTFYYLFLPLTIVFNGAGNAIVRAFGILPASEAEETHSEIELRTLISQSTRQGTLQKRDEDMLEGVFELGETVAREVMVPRPDVVTLSAQTPFGQLAKVAATGNYTRYPLFEGENVDRIIGAVHVKDILQAAEAAGSFVEADVVARDLMRELITVPENRLIEDVLAKFQRRRIHMAVVIDEWGSFEGIITLEDILEEIVGEIRDEFDEEEPVIRKMEDGSYSIEGRIPIKAVNEVLGSTFESEDFDTTGGLVLGLLGRPPNVDDEVAFNGHIFRVESVDGARIAQLNVRDDSSSSGERLEAQGSDARRIFLQPQNVSPTGRRAVLEKIEALLKDHPDEEVELVAEDPAMALAGQGKPLLGLLVQSGLSVAVRNDVWKVQRRRTTRLRRPPARRAGV
jgi:CBS domain containing-hemolysin-like protein